MIIFNICHDWSLSSWDSERLLNDYVEKKVTFFTLSRPNPDLFPASNNYSSSPPLNQQASKYPWIKNCRMNCSTTILLLLLSKLETICKILVYSFGNYLIVLIAYIFSKAVNKFCDLLSESNGSIEEVTN